MINIFHKIRRKLAEDNNVKKYLRYAIGEILLVVIGILIALQINNWNVKKTNIKSAYSHLTILKNNVENDLKEITQLKSSIDNVIHYSDTLIMQLMTLYPVNYNTGQYLTELLLEYNFNPNYSGFQTLNNAGELPYLSDSLQIQIMNYYALVDAIKAREEISNKFIKDKYEPYYFNQCTYLINKQNPFPFYQEFYKDDPRPVEPLDTSKILADKKLESLIMARLYQSLRQIKYYEKAIIDIRNLLHTISKEEKLAEDF